jgi:hypothetical protein
MKRRGDIWSGKDISVHNTKWRGKKQSTRLQFLIRNNWRAENTKEVTCV